METIKVIYAVLAEQGGAHESCDVMSVWTERVLAEKECNRRNELPEHSRGWGCRVEKWELNTVSDTILNW